MNEKIMALVKDLFSETKKKKTIFYMAVSLVFALYLNGIFVQSEFIFADPFGNQINVTASLFRCMLYGIYRPGRLVVVFFIFCLLGLYLSTILKKPKQDDYKIAESGEYGTARFLEEKELKEVFKVEKATKTADAVFGMTEDKKKVYTYNMDTSKRRIISNNHKAVIAGSGKGKTASIAIPDAIQAIRRGESIILTDPKGDVYKVVVAIAKAYGYEVKVFNSKNPSVSDSCNFLSIVGNNSLAARKLAAVIIQNTLVGEADGFSAAAEYLLAGIILYFTAEKKEFNPLECNMSKINEFVKQPLDVMQNRFLQLSPKHPARKAALGFFDSSENFKANARFSLMRHLTMFDDESVEAMTTYNDIDILAAGKKKCAYFIITHDQDSTLDALPAMFFDCAFTLLCDYADKKLSQQLDVPVNFIFDEFPNIAMINDFQRRLNTVRSRLISITIIFQNIGQMMERYPNQRWTSIIFSCETIVFLGGMDVVNTLPLIVKLLGETTAETERSNMTHSKLMPMMDDMRLTYDISKSRIERALMSVSELRTLHEDKQIVIFGNQQPIKVNKFLYHYHPFYKKYEELNAYDYIPDHVKNKRDVEKMNESKDEVRNINKPNNSSELTGKLPSYLILTEEKESPALPKNKGKTLSNF